MAPRRLTLKQRNFINEYLSNGGIRAVKPDRHIMNICGSERLGLFPEGATEEQASQIFM